MRKRDGQDEIDEIVNLATQQLREIAELNHSATIEPRFIKQMLISRFRQLTDLTEQTAMAIAVATVKDGDITKRGAADRLRVHPHTIDRNITRFEERYKAESASPLSDVLNNREE